MEIINKAIKVQDERRLVYIEMQMQPAQTSPISFLWLTSQLWLLYKPSGRGVKLISRVPHQPRGCLQRAECNFNSLTVKE